MTCGAIGRSKKPGSGRNSPAAPGDIAGRPPLAFLDLEASSLHHDSFPIEIGWVFEDGSGESFLIRPEPGWKDWSSDAQALHGLCMETLLREGLPATEVARRAADALKGRLVVSDAPGADQKWLDRLTEVAGMPSIATVRHHHEALNVACRRLNVLLAGGAPDRAWSDALVRETASRIVTDAHSAEQHRGPARHRALDDARSLWRIWRSVSDAVADVLAGDGAQ